MSNEDCQINMEPGLQDVTDINSKYVDEKNLNSMGKECKSWQDSALQEQGKRAHIQHLRLPYEHDSIGNLANKLQVNPYVSLLIVDHAFEQNLYLRGEKIDKLHYNLLKEFKKKLQNKTILFEACTSFTTYGAEYGGTKEERHPKLEPGCRDILGFFIPNAPQRITVRAAYISNATVKTKFRDCIPGLGGVYHEQCSEKRSRMVPCVADRLAKELGLNDCEYPKSTLLFIGFMQEWTSDCIFELCEREQQNGKEVTLASLVGRPILLADSSREQQNGTEVTLATYVYHRGLRQYDFPKLYPKRMVWLRQFLRSKKQPKSLLGIVLRISGPSVESWSTFIYYFETSDEIERKLHQLKEKVKRKRYCTGLFSGPECRCRNHTNHPCADRQEMMKRVNRIFTGIPFVGSHSFAYYNNNQVDYSIPKDEFDENDVTKGFCFKFYASVLIISHD